MKWTVKAVSETESGHAAAEQTLVAIERTDQLTVEDLGLSLAEAKRLLATLQRLIVTVQIEEYGAAYRGCSDCHQLLHTKGYYRPSFRSAFGRVRCPPGAEPRGAQPRGVRVDGLGFGWAVGTVTKGRREVTWSPRRDRSRRSDEIPGRSWG